MLTVTLCFFSYPEYNHNITGLPYPEPGQPAVNIPEPDKTHPPPFSPALACLEMAFTSALEAKLISTGMWCNQVWQAHVSFVRQFTLQYW